MLRKSGNPAKQEQPTFCPSIVLQSNARKDGVGLSMVCSASTLRGVVCLTHYYFLIVPFTFYHLLHDMFSIAVLPHRSGVVYYRVLLRRETRDEIILWLPPFLFNRNLGFIGAYKTEILYNHSLWKVVNHSSCRSKMH